MEQSETIGNLAGALAAAQAEIRNPPLDAINPHFKNRYATLAAHLDAVRGPLASQGIALIQTIENDDAKIACVTTLAHKSGEWMRSSVSMPMPDRSTAQQLGSLATYLRRYSLAACCLIVGDTDDDADGDRRMREPTQRTPTRELLDPAPAKGGKSSSTKPGKSNKKFPDEGSTVVSIERLVPRDNGVVAAFVSTVEYGAEWISMTTQQAQNLKVDTRATVSWRWSAMGFFTAVAVTAAPRLSDFRDEKGELEIPLLKEGE